MQHAQIFPTDLPILDAPKMQETENTGKGSLQKNKVKNTMLKNRPPIPSAKILSLLDTKPKSFMQKIRL